MELSKKQKKKALDVVLGDITRADAFYTETVEPLLLERYNVYEANKEYYERKFPRLSQKSDLVSYDMWSMVQWSLAPILSAFFGTDEIVSIVGHGAEDAHRGEKMRQLVLFQILKQNKGFMKFTDWIRDAFIFELGVVKAYWKRETETTKFQEKLPPMRLEEMMQDEKINILNVSDPDKFGDFDVTYEVKEMIENRPVIESVRPTDLRWSPGARTLSEANFVAQRKVVMADHLRRKAEKGIYDKKAVDAAIEGGGTVVYTDLELQMNPELDDYKDDSDDKARTSLILYECYCKMDVNDDGLLEDVLCTVAGNQLLRIEENDYGIMPFFPLSPNKDPYKVLPTLGFSEVIGELQHLKTAMIRQVTVNLALNNAPRTYVDDVKVVMDDLTEDREYVRVHGRPSEAIFSQAVQPIAAWTLPFFEYIESLMEQWTGRTRYNQGLDAKSLNKTASGMSMIMQASTQRIGQIIRNMAETGVGELFSFLVKMNQKYIRQDQVIRLLNEPLEISLDDLSGQYDIDVNVDVGIGEKQQTVQNLQLFLGMLFPQGQAMGILNQSHWARASRKILQELGIRNVDDYVPKPEDALAQGQQMQMQQQMMMGGMPGVPGQNGQAPGGNPAGPSGGVLQGLPPELAGIASAKFAR